LLLNIIFAKWTESSQAKCQGNQPFKDNHLMSLWKNWPV